MSYIEYSTAPLDSRRWGKKKFFAFCSIPLGLQTVLFYLISFLTQDFSIFDTKSNIPTSIIGKISGALMVCLVCHYGITRAISWGVNFRLYDTSSPTSLLIECLKKISIAFFVLFCIFPNVIWYLVAVISILMIVIYGTLLPSDRKVNLYGARTKNTFTIEVFSFVTLIFIVLNIKFIAGILSR